MHYLYSSPIFILLICIIPVLKNEFSIRMGKNSVDPDQIRSYLIEIYSVFKKKRKKEENLGTAGQRLRFCLARTLLTLCVLMSSADNLYKQFGPRSRKTEHWAGPDLHPNC